ncbi:MAG: hypothetical protein KME49_31210 [Brasilonema octagenarum HA4186-MV1]|jgi:hypothetical protein|nr:hypothetical protein [Brasilonema sennae]MBW4629861.1 hypothetical protein [Brasilonema octagenarum HA4186-MV1]
MSNDASHIIEILCQKVKSLSLQQIPHPRYRAPSREVLQRGGSFSGEASPENVPWEPQRSYPTEGNPPAALAPQRTGSP